MTYQEILLSRFEKSKISQRQAAKRAGVNYVTINRILNDSYGCKPTGETLGRLMDAIGSPSDEKRQVFRMAGSMPSDLCFRIAQAEDWCAENEATVIHLKGRVEVLAHCARGQGKGLVEAVEAIRQELEREIDMPIRKSERGRYPKDWPQIRARILERAGNRCEGSPMYPDCRAENYKPHPVTASYVVLTIAHLDHQPEHNEETNLQAWCQRCHLTYDAQHHASNAAQTRRAKKNNLELFEVKQ